VGADGTTTTLDFDGHSLAVDSGSLPDGLAQRSGREIVVGVRPEAFEIRSAAGAGGSAMTVTSSLVEQLGSEAYVHFAVPVRPVVTADIEALLAEEGTDAAALGDETKFTARVNPDHAPRVGQSTELVVDTTKLHYFDPETGDTL